MKKQLLFWCLLMSATFSVNAQLNYQWAKAIGGSGNDYGKAAATDDFGNVYVTGVLGHDADSINFNPYGAAENNAYSAGLVCFYAKYNSEGTCLWVKTFNAPNAAFSLGSAIQVKHDGSRVYIGGLFFGQVYFDQTNNISLTSDATGGSSNFDSFIAECNGLDGTLNWVKPVKGTGTDIATGLTLDEAQNMVYLTGSFEQSANFDPLGSNNVKTSNGGTDAFLAAFNTTSGTASWATAIGGVGNDVGNTIAVDLSGNIAISGSFTDSVDFNAITSPDTMHSLGGSDIFLAKYNTAGTCLWVEEIGGSNPLGNEGTTAMVIDAYDYIHMTGYFEGTTDFDPDPNQTKGVNIVGKRDIFFAKYSSSGAVEFAKPISSTSITDSIASASIAVNKEGKIFLTGYVKGSAQFDPAGTNSLTSTTLDSQDVFFAKYESDGSFGWAKLGGSNGADYGTGVTVDTLGNCYFIGGFSDSVDFDMNNGTAVRNCNGYLDIFIAKYGYGAATISGLVTHNGSALYSGTNIVRLYTQVPNDGNQAMHLVDEQPISITGYYFFSNVPAGNYLVLALPDIIYADSIVATYYGDITDWSLADTIFVVNNINSYTANIHLSSYSFPNNGAALLSGRIYEGFGFDRGPGDPIPGVGVGLDHDPGGSIVTQTTTDIDGYYEFNNVSPGNYTIYVNIPGLPLETYHVVVNPSDTAKTHLDFVADSASIDTVPAISTFISSFVNRKTQLTVFPNPYKEITIIEFLLPKSNEVKLEVLNILGEKVLELINEEKSAGVVKCVFNPSEKGLKPGIYLLKLTVAGETITRKIVQSE